MFNDVIDLGLIPKRPYIKREKTDLIVLHMSGSTSKDETVQSIHKSHIQKGNKGIDYNIVIERDGDVVWGRGLEYEGGHVANGNKKTAGVNARSVGICCLGDFEVERMPASQLESLKRIVADVVLHYEFKSVKQIVTHDGIAGPGYTDCPGKNFPYDAVIKHILNYKTVEPTPDPRLWKVIVRDLNFRATPGGKILKVLHFGDLIYLRRYVESEDWSRVRLGGPDGKEGYVWLKYIGRL